MTGILTARPSTQRTNGIVKHFNGRIADVLKAHRFNGREDMEQTLLRYMVLYGRPLPQSALESKMPLQAMKAWYQTHPQLFHKRPYDRPGCDTYTLVRARVERLKPQASLGRNAAGPGTAHGVQGRERPAWHAN